MSNLNGAGRHRLQTVPDSSVGNYSLGAPALPPYMGNRGTRWVRSRAFSRDFLPHLRGRLVRSEPT